MTKLRRLGGALLLLALAVGAWDAVELWRERALAREIEAGTPMAAGDPRPRRIFAEALRLAAAGETLPALALYRQLGRDVAPELYVRARFNSGNLYLREALRLRQAGDATALAQSLPLLELAKLAYRDVLREEAQHWDARYNLEQALRVAPEGDEQAAPPEPPRHADRAVPTLMGIPQGQP